MLRLLMIADDFTGALDTGVQLAAHGIPTQVVVGQADLSACSSTVLVVDTETRHLSAAKAAEAVARLTRSAVENGVGCIYKKTDSALRGNIGAELAALLKASGARNLPFLPAFPQIGRTTKKGVHYIDGVPVNESPFGIDPFEPVRCAEVTKLIHLQTEIPAQNLCPGETAADKTGILVYDAATAADLETAGRQLFQNGTPPVLAGCAGFAAFLPELLGLSDGSVVETPQLDPRLLVLCDSVNPITQPPGRSWNPATGQAPTARLRWLKLKPCWQQTPAALLKPMTPGATSLPPITPPPGALTWTACGWAFPAASGRCSGRCSAANIWALCCSPAATPCCSA